MLVLSRAKGESIRIGNVLVTIVKIGANDVRIGVDAPRDVAIARCEIDLEPEKTERLYALYGRPVS